MSNDTRISDDLRYELADAARVSAAANRPRSLLVLATLLFLIAGVALIVTLRQRDRAAEQYRVQSERKILVEGLAMQFAALDSLDATNANLGNQPLPDILSRIERAAEDAGLEPPAVPQPTRQIVQGAVKVTYRYRIQDGSLENLLDWVVGAQEAVPGLEVSSLDLTPRPRVWELQVTYVRWERAS